MKIDIDLTDKETRIEMIRKLFDYHAAEGMKKENHMDTKGFWDGCNQFIAEADEVLNERMNTLGWKSALPIKLGNINVAIARIQDMLKKPLV